MIVKNITRFSSCSLELGGAYFFFLSSSLATTKYDLALYLHKSYGIILSFGKVIFTSQYNYKYIIRNFLFIYLFIIIIYREGNHILLKKDK